MLIGVARLLSIISETPANSIKVDRPGKFTLPIMFCAKGCFSLLKMSDKQLVVISNQVNLLRKQNNPLFIYIYTS